VVTGIALPLLLAPPSSLLPSDSIDRPLQQLAPLRDRLFPQRELRIGLHQLIRRHRHRPHRDATRQGEREPSLHSLPDLVVERLTAERNAARRMGVIGVFHLDGEPPCREAAPPELVSQRLGQPTEQGVQDAEIVAVGGEGMGESILRLHLGGQHRPSVDPPRLRAKQPPPAAEHGAQLALADGGDLPDPLELIFVESNPDVVGNLGKNRDPMRGKERRFRTIGNEQGPDVGRTDGQTDRRTGLFPPAVHTVLTVPTVPTVHPSCSGRRLRHQLVDGHPDGERQPQPRERLAPNPLRHIHRGAEEPLGAGEIEKSVAVAARLDDRRVDLEDLVERAGGAGVESGIGGKKDQIGTKLPGAAHQHAPRHTRRLRLGRKREDDGAIGARRRHSKRPAPKCRSDHPFDGGDEGRRIDEQDRLQGGNG
jgi:hypothetical protein